MTLDTEIPGDAGSIESVASWLRDSLGTELDSAADTFNQARQDAGSGWDSEAGDAIEDMLKRARETTDNLADAARDIASDLDEFAFWVRKCQSEMADVRTDATNGKLTVVGFLISPPAPEVPKPDAPTRTPTPEEQKAYGEALLAWGEYQEKVRVWDCCVAEAGRIDRRYEAAVRALTDSYAPVHHAGWMVTMGEVLGDSALAALAVRTDLRTSALNRKAAALIQEADRLTDTWIKDPKRYTRRPWWRPFRETFNAKRLAADAAFIQGKLDDAERLLDHSEALAGKQPPKLLTRGAKVLGPAGIALGVANDWNDGETVTQIAVSQGGSALAAIGTGAAIGATVGMVVPVAGPAIGAAVGAIAGVGVAIFTDGAIDSLFEKGPDVGKAWSAGVDSLKDTGEAIGSFFGGFFD